MLNCKFSHLCSEYKSSHSRNSISRNQCFLLFRYLIRACDLPLLEANNVFKTVLNNYCNSAVCDIYLSHYYICDNVLQQMTTKSALNRTTPANR